MSCFSAPGYILTAGTLLVIIGITFYAIAGRRRERETALTAPEGPRSGFGVGLIICIASGILSAMLNFSFSLWQRVAGPGAFLWNQTVRLGESDMGVGAHLGIHSQRRVCHLPSPEASNLV